MSSIVSLKKLLEVSVEDMMKKSDETWTPCVYVDANDSVRDVLTKLAEHRLQGLPVMSGSGEDLDVVGFISTLSVLKAVAFTTYDPTTGVFDPAKALEMSSGVSARDVVMSCGENEEERSTWFCEETTPLSDLLDAYVRGVHRVVTAHRREGNDFDLYVVSQTDVVRFLFEQVDQCSDLQNVMATRLEALNLVSEPAWHEDPVFSLPENATAIQAFYALVQHNVRAVPLRNRFNEVADVLSASDLRHVADNWDALMYPVRMFLRMGAPSGVRHPPVTCPRGASVHWVVTLMVLHRIHQVWIVDTVNHPIGVVSMTDIIHLFSA